MNILTCNVRIAGAAAKDGPNAWPHRKDLCAAIIRSRSPDVICFQEMWAEQFADLSAAFPGYRSYGLTDEPAGRHPLNCIFYRSDIYMLISAGGYWLSRTPHIPGSKSWNSNCVRLANWVRLKDRVSGVEFRLINAHLDHLSQRAREGQARLIVEDALAYPPDYPQILTGDMNCDARNAAISVYKTGGWTDTYGAVHGRRDPGQTFHGFLGPKYKSETGKMDWIFARGAVEIVDADVIDDSSDGRFPSDHYFVSATVIPGSKPRVRARVSRKPRKKNHPASSTRRKPKS